MKKSLRLLIEKAQMVREQPRVMEKVLERREGMKGLKVLEKGVQTVLTDNFADVVLVEEPDPRGFHLITAIAKCMGESLGRKTEELSYPTHWRRFLKRKDCPVYLKQISSYEVNAYYPRLSLPKEEHYINFDKVR